MKAAKTLDKLRIKMIDALSQGNDQGLSRDGMDIIVCKINKELKILEYAGSNLPLYLVRDGKLFEYKANTMPIRMHLHNYQSFKGIDIELKKNDNIVLATDGYADQFGQETNTKFFISKLKELLVDISKKNLFCSKRYISGRIFTMETKQRTNR